MNANASERELGWLDQRAASTGRTIADLRVAEVVLWLFAAAGDLDDHADEDELPRLEIDVEHHRLRIRRKWCVLIGIADADALIASVGQHDFFHPAPVQVELCRAIRVELDFGVLVMLDVFAWPDGDGELGLCVENQLVRVKSVLYDARSDLHEKFQIGFALCGE